MLSLLAIPKAEQGVTERNEANRRLLLRIADGDPTALEELYGRMHTAVYALALSYLRNVHDAQDITQDTFVRVWDKAQDYRATGSATAWVLTVCRNLSLMKLRSETRQTTLDDAEWDAIPANSGSVTQEDRVLLQELLSQLDAQARRIVLLHAVSGLKHREIAALLTLPLPTVLSKYHRAMKKMRARMEGDENA